MSLCMIGSVTLHQRERWPKAPLTLSGADPLTSSSSTYTSLHPVRLISMPNA